MLNVDTHILVDFVQGALRPRERSMVRDEELAICDVVLWEIEKLNQLDRLELDTEDPRFVALLGQIHVFPITIEIARTSCRLDFRSGPADELIAANPNCDLIAWAKL